jgi:murein DD-endopeptidase MepM/ murein hydrolase activator NlpD
LKAALRYLVILPPVKRILQFALVILASCGSQHHFTSTTEIPADSSYVYALPFPEGTRHRVIQGYNSGLSHKNRLALDFKIKKGSPVTAARSGVVVRVEQNFTKGGIGKKYLRKANQVVILHDDGSQSYYGHLQYHGALVKVGDSVRQGQPIAKSGSTGYSALPHLHFIAWGPVPGRGRSQLPTRFKTNKGIKYLKPGKRYVSVKMD